MDMNVNSWCDQSYRFECYEVSVYDYALLDQIFDAYQVYFYRRALVFFNNISINLVIFAVLNLMWTACIIA